MCVYTHRCSTTHIHMCIYISHISHISFSGKYIILGRLVAGGRFYISISHVCLALVSMAPDGLCRVATDPLIRCQIVPRLGFRASVCGWARLRVQTCLSAQTQSLTHVCGGASPRTTGVTPATDHLTHKCLAFAWTHVRARRLRIGIQV